MTLKPTLMAAALMLALGNVFAAEPSAAEQAAARKELDAARSELREIERQRAAALRLPAPPGRQGSR